MRCDKGNCETPATRHVALSSSFVQITRAFCDEHAKELCANPGVAGVMKSGGVREPLVGTDLGPIQAGN